jgi:hypothetical protein
MIKQAWTLYFVVIFLTFAFGISLAKADERTAVSKVDKNITFTITDSPCTFFPSIPSGAPLKAAKAYDATTKVSLVGCALDYGDLTELQLVNEAEKKHYQLMIPTKDFI